MKKIFLIVLTLILCSCGGYVSQPSNIFSEETTSRYNYTKGVETDIPTTKGVFYIKKYITLKQLFVRYYYEGDEDYYYKTYYKDGEDFRHYYPVENIRVYGENVEELKITENDESGSDFFTCAARRHNSAMISLDVSTDCVEQKEVRVTSIEFTMNNIEFKAKTELVFKIAPDAEFACDTQSILFLPFADFFDPIYSYNHVSLEDPFAVIRVNTENFNADFGDVTIESFRFENISNLKIEDFTWRTSRFEGADGALLYNKYVFKWNEFFLNGEIHCNVRSTENDAKTLDYYTIVFEYSFAVEPERIYTAVVRTDVTGDSLRELWV